MENSGESSGHATPQQRGVGRLQAKNGEKRGGLGVPVKRGGSNDSKWHWNIALVATIQRYAGLASSGQRRQWPC